MRHRGRPPFLEVRGLQVRIGSRTILKGIDWAAWPGEIAVIMGRNGAGKTTLIKSLVGLVRPQGGSVWVEGASIAGRPVAEICRQVGYLPQDPNTLLFAETVRDELDVTLRNHDLLKDKPGHPPAPRSTFPDELLARLGLTAKAGIYPRDLSVGERQRVALAAVTVTQPGALLLDEPTRGLDYRAKHGLTQLLKEWREEGMAIVVVTHDVELAAALADRVLMLSQGEILAEGPPVEVLGGLPLFAPQVARLFPNTGWLTAEDVLAYQRSLRIASPPGGGVAGAAAGARRPRKPPPGGR